MSTIADYQGRKFDIMAFQPKPSETKFEQALTSYDSGGLICVGIQKLAQRWVLEFLTPVGSMPYIPGRGTSFMRKIRYNGNSTNIDIVAFFGTAAEEIRINFLKEDRLIDPDDERYSSASLDGFSINADKKLVLNVSILSVAGTARKVIIPISVSAGLI